MDIRPVDMPGLRDEVRSHVRRHGEAFYQGRSNEGALSFFAHTGRAPSGSQLAKCEVDRLAQADLFHVNADMTDLARVAGASMPDFSLAPEDLPSECGFMHWVSPVAASDEAETVRYAAASWGPVATHRAADSAAPAVRGTWVNWYFDTDWYHDMLSGVEDIPNWFVKREVGRLCLDLEMVIPFSQFTFESAGLEHDLFRTLKATWVLMSQPVASNALANYDRATRRRLARENQEPEPVRVITLRRAASGSGAGESDREYHHRWIVRGHWRQQWYPSRGANRPVWIAPHIKGPEDAPLLGGEKVYALKR